MRTAAVLALLAAGCAGRPAVEALGDDCRGEMDPSARLEIVSRILDSGDERAIPVLIDCLEAARKRGKLPDRVYGTGSLQPNVTAPPELWGLYVLTGQDYDGEFARWREWYARHQGRLEWDGARRRFTPR